MPGKKPKDGPSLQSPDLRMNNGDNSHAAKRDLYPERRSDWPMVTGLLAVKLGLKPSLLPCRWTQGVGCSGILSPLHVLSTSSGPSQVMGAGNDMGRDGAPTLTSGAHSPGKSAHTCMYTNTHTPIIQTSHDEGTQS